MKSPRSQRRSGSRKPIALENRLLPAKTMVGCWLACRNDTMLSPGALTSSHPVPGARGMDSATTEIKTRSRTAGRPAPQGTLSPEELRKLDAYWRASNYLSVGQIYLFDNPLLKEPLKRQHVKPRL